MSEMSYGEYNKTKREGLLYYWYGIWVGEWNWSGDESEIERGWTGRNTPSLGCGNPPQHKPSLPQIQIWPWTSEGWPRGYWGHGAVGSEMLFYWSHSTQQKANPENGLDLAKRCSENTQAESVDGRGYPFVYSLHIFGMYLENLPTPLVCLTSCMVHSELGVHCWKCQAMLVPLHNHSHMLWHFASSFLICLQWTTTPFKTNS